MITNNSSPVSSKVSLKEQENHSDIQRVAEVLAHDFKNALTSIGLSVRQLEDDLKQEELKDYLTIIKRNCENINNRLDELLCVTTFELLNIEEIDIHTIIDKVLFEAEIYLKTKDIKIIKNYEEGMSCVQVDEKKIKKALSNLILNAFEAMGENEDNILTISTQRAGKHRIIHISDNGVGIPDENTSKIFAPYFTTKKQRKGGLGLTETEKIIQNHQAEIKVKSKLNTGTTFSIILDLA